MNAKIWIILALDNVNRILGHQKLTHSHKRYAYVSQPYL